VPHFASVFLACLYQRYLSLNIEQPSAVLDGIDEQAESKIKLNNKKKYLNFLKKYFINLVVLFIKLI
jgi:hypothetical protein